MRKDLIWQLGIFVLVLLILNTFFQMHISIIGSLVLTIVLSLVFNFIQQVDSISWGNPSMARLQNRR